MSLRAEILRLGLRLFLERHNQPFDCPNIFSKGTYRHLTVEGSDRNHVIAYAREHEQTAVIVAVGRHFVSLTRHGRHWPRGAFNATFDTSAYAVDTFSGVLRTGKLPVAILMVNLSTAMLTARKLSPEG